MKKILFIDDDLHLLTSYRRLFLKEKKNFFVHFESDSKKGCYIALQEKWDFLICDRLMPGISGEEILKEVHLKFPATKKVLLSGKESDMVSQPYIHHYLHKPFPFEDILNLLKEND